MNSLTSQLKVMLPIVILLFGCAVAWMLIDSRSDLNQSLPQNDIPAVQVVQAIPQTLTLNIYSQGVVTPRTEIDLIPEVGGRIIKLHSVFVTGGGFKAGDVLVTIDPRDYDHAIVRAQALVAEAKHRLAREEEEAGQSRYEWQVLSKERPPTPLMLREPQLAEARAKLKAAEADLVHARLLRNRCEWRAPFSGKIREKLVGLGQFVQPGVTLARLYATDIAEIRLPITKDQLSYIDWPIESQGNRGKQPRVLPKVILSTQYSGIKKLWEGHIIRLEGAFNETTGLVYVVAEINWEHTKKDNNFPLLPGLFVQAEIKGRAQPNLFRLPRESVNANRTILAIDAQGRLRIRHVHFLRIETNYVLVRDGLEVGDLIVTSSIPVPIEGTKLHYEIIELDSQIGEEGATVLSTILIE
ncbi:MAG: efflux RND transporter periplasmic adaptor subunit [Nitrosomonas sp.]|nr:efflux RND transporter periplasmic adaptor subunit [Nitrosomonas sp.]